jgi:rare lipoprotein A
MALAGCGRHQTQANKVPPAPPISAPASKPATEARNTPPPRPNATPVPAVPHISDEIVVPRNAKVLYTETGWASWYGPGFQKRRAANGEVFDTEKMTAAHRTLPLNSIVRVTDLKTSESVLVRITDRGPFVGDRILDLSRAAARKLSVFQHGTALVRIEVLETPVSIRTGGRWCVQIGAFADRRDAARLKEKLSRRYHTARVLQFSSPQGGDWLRVLVAQDDKRRAESLMKETHTDAGMFLVRLD